LVPSKIWLILAFRHSALSFRLREPFRPVRRSVGRGPGTFRSRRAQQIDHRAVGPHDRWNAAEVQADLDAAIDRNGRVVVLDLDRHGPVPGDLREDSILIPPKDRPVHDHACPARLRKEDASSSILISFGSGSGPCCSAPSFGPAPKARLTLEQERASSAEARRGKACRVHRSSLSE
jgi:hypothetical protein